jgi:xanthine/uracil permease
MKITRKWLLIITASLGVLLIGYSLVKQFFKFEMPEKFEKHFTEGVVIAALGLFMYNRKLASDEKKAREAEEAEALKAEEEEEPISKEDENLPHWERQSSSSIEEDDD